MSECPCDPCAVSPTNTAACESLPSALDNFITQFFGSVTKSVVDGKVVWTLPCNLSEGLPDNPREEGEGLACYFLRLFLDGITGLTGPTGATGATGATGPAGKNSFSITTADFVQPAVDASVNIYLADGSWAVEGLYIFVQDSGYYLVTAVVGNTLYAKFVAPGTTTGGTIPSGNLVVPAGPQGAPGADA